VYLSVCLRLCGDAVVSGCVKEQDFALSLKPWTSSKAQTEKHGQGKDGVEGGLEVAQPAQG
jgi:hypothetical protein